MRPFFTTLLCVILFVSCNSNQSAQDHNDTVSAANKRHSYLDIEAIKKQIAAQHSMENNDVLHNQVHFLDQKDVEISLAVINEGLAEAGYKTPDKVTFEKRIKELYNCENNDNAIWKGTHLKNNITSDSWMAPKKFINYYGDAYGEAERKDYQMIAFGKYNFVFDLDFLKDLIIIKPDGQYTTTLSKNLIARNLYLFNGNKADLNYLLHNDLGFLQTLVAVFGYDKVPEINGAVLNEYNTGTNEDIDIGSVVFSNILIPGKLLIRKGLLNYIYTHTTKNNNNMERGLSDYVFRYSEFDSYAQVSFENKCKMLAYTGALEQQLRDKYMGTGTAIWNSRDVLTNFKLQWPRFIDEIKYQNCYNDPEIKKAIARAEDEAQAALIKADPDK